MHEIASPPAGGSMTNNEYDSQIPPLKEVAAGRRMFGITHYDLIK